MILLWTSMVVIGLSGAFLVGGLLYDTLEFYKDRRR